MSAFQLALISIDDRWLGKINWDSALHYYFLGLSAEEAAKKYNEYQP